VKIKGLEFERTCHECPEQYDVFDADGKQVGYVRLRWVCFRVDYPEVGEETIFEADVGEDMTGRFDSEEERQRYLTAAADAINSKIEAETPGAKGEG